MGLSITNKVFGQYISGVPQSSQFISGNNCFINEEWGFDIAFSYSKDYRINTSSQQQKREKKKKDYVAQLNQLTAFLSNQSRISFN